MSVTLTKQAVYDRVKTETRRTGWLFAAPGQTITLCEKVMGRKKGDPLVRICDVLIHTVKRERLDAICDRDVAAEGFSEADLLPYHDPEFERPPHCTCPARPGERMIGCRRHGHFAQGWLSRAFVRYFVMHMGVAPSTIVTVIQWRYLDGEG